MDNYDVVIEKTVKDLFRSSNLNQIKKYKFSKEREILSKDEEMQKLILDKYPLLIKSISSLEQISNNLNELQEIRKKFGENVTKLEVLENKFHFSEFDNKDEKFSTFKSSFSIQEDDIIDNLQDQIDECQSLLSENKFDHLLINLINLKQKIENKNFLKENFEFILVDYMECLIKKIISVKFSENSYEFINKELIFYFLHFYCIFSLFFDNYDKLFYSQVYLKLENDDDINNLFLKIIKKDSAKKSFNKNENYFLKTMTFMIKLFLLKLSKNFNNLQNSEKLESKIDDLGEILINNYLIIYIHLRLLNEKNELNGYGAGSDSDSVSDNEEYLNYVSKNKNKKIFNLNNLINTINSILSLNLGTFNIKKLLQENFLDISIIFLDLLNTIKEDVIINLKIQNENIISLLNFWNGVYDKHIHFQKFNQDISILNYLPENLQKDENSFFNYFFLEKSTDSLENIFKNELKKCKNHNFNNKFNHQDIKIIEFLEGLTNNQNKLISENLTFREEIIKTFQKLLSDFLISKEKLINEWKENLSHFNYITFIVKIFGNIKFMSLLIKLNLHEEIKIIKHLINIFFEIEFKQMHLYMKEFREYLNIEKYLEHENIFLISNSLMELTNFLILNYNYDEIYLEEKNLEKDNNYSQEQIKSKLLDIIIKNYIEEFDSSINEESIISKKFINDLIVLNKIWKEIKKDENIDLDQMMKKNNISFINIDINYDYLYNFFTKTQKKSAIYPTKIFLSIQEENMKSRSKKREDIFYNQRLSNYLIVKPEVDKIKNKQSSLINTTSKILEFRIDENYISVKNSQNNQQQNQNNTMPPTVNALKNNFKQNTINAHNTQNTQNPQNANIKNVLGFFGGMLKENISNITNYVVNNPNFKEIPQQNKSPNKNQKN